MKTTLLSLCLVFVMGIYKNQAQDNARETADRTEISESGNNGIPPVQVNPQSDGDIYSNGPYYNEPGDPNFSILERSLGLNILGFGHGQGAAFRVADDWEVTEEVEVGNIQFYAYQTGSTTNSTFTHVSLQIWDGDPDDPNSTVVYGDPVTNVLSHSEWSGAYRASETDPTNIDRPIMINTVNTPGLVLQPGTYWLDWDANGSLESGPWAPPISISGETETGNAKQYNPSEGGWADLIDTGTEEDPVNFPQGLPFEVNSEPLINVAGNSIPGFTYYPNPVTDFLIISAADRIERVSFINYLGQEVHKVEVGAEDQTVDLSELAMGVYIMKITSDNTVASYKLIKR